MPQAMPAMASLSHDGKKRRGHEAALSPRSSPPTRMPMATQERLPPIRTLLSDIPQSSERALSQLRTPMKQDATGPRPVIPARLSPPPLSRRSHIQTRPELSNGATKSPRHVAERHSSRPSYDQKPAHQLPIHSGPPVTRTIYSPSSLGPPPVSPYATTSTDPRRGYSKGESHSLPPPPMPYHDMSNGHHSSYIPSKEYSSSDQGYAGNQYGGTRHRDSRSAALSSYHSTQSTYQSVQYSYPAPPPISKGNYAATQQYQNGYHQGSVSFESDESGGSAPRRRRGNLPRDTTDMLKQWFTDHLSHPYPSEDEKQMLCRQTGLQMTQISNWFINARRRRIPELVNQATAEARFRENSGESSGSSD